MDENHNVEKTETNPTEEEVLARRAEEAHERRLDGHIWKNCCEFNEAEAYYMRSNIHFAHVLRKQYINGQRWFEITRLRSMEIQQNRTDLVHRFECWMRKLDRNLADDGLFVGSNTKKYMVCPVLGPIPLYKYWSN